MAVLPEISRAELRRLAHRVPLPNRRRGQRFSEYSFNTAEGSYSEDPHKGCRKMSERYPLHGLTNLPPPASGAVQTTTVAGHPQRNSEKLSPTPRLRCGSRVGNSSPIVPHSRAQTPHSAIEQ